MRSNQTLNYLSSFIRGLPQLTGREREILAKRLKGVTLEEIGRLRNLSEARIRQIEKVAILKAKSKIRQLGLFR